MKQQGWDRRPIALTVWCCAFAGLHVFWALGGSVGLASSAGAELAARRPVAFVVFGLWGVAALLLAGAGLVRAVQRARPPWRRAGGWLIVSVGAVLLVRGVAVEILLLTDAGGVRTAVGPSQTRWSLVLWNPWFVLGGALFIGAGLRPSITRRRRSVRSVASVREAVREQDRDRNGTDDGDDRDNPHAVRLQDVVENHDIA